MIEGGGITLHGADLHGLGGTDTNCRPRHFDLGAIMSLERWAWAAVGYESIDWGRASILVGSLWLDCDVRDLQRRRYGVSLKVEAKHMQESRDVEGTQMHTFRRA